MRSSIIETSNQLSSWETTREVSKEENGVKDNDEEASSSHYEVKKEVE